MWLRLSPSTVGSVCTLFSAWSVGGHVVDHVVRRCPARPHRDNCLTGNRRPSAALAARQDVLLPIRLFSMSCAAVLCSAGPGSECVSGYWLDCPSRKTGRQGAPHPPALGSCLSMAIHYPCSLRSKRLGPFHRDPVSRRGLNNACRLSSLHVTDPHSTPSHSKSLSRPVSAYHFHFSGTFFRNKLLSNTIMSLKHVIATTTGKTIDL